MEEVQVLINTDWTDMITNGLVKETVLVSGNPAIMTFINKYLNTEDVCNVSREWTGSGLMVWKEVINYHLPPEAGYIMSDMIYA